MNAVEVLKAARAILAVPGQWTKKHFACDGFGSHVSELDPRAVCWCAMGAIYKSLDGDIHRSFEARKYLNLAAYSLHNVEAIVFNDSHATKHEDVLALYDRAIELAEKS